MAVKISISLFENGRKQCLEIKPRQWKFVELFLSIVWGYRSSSNVQWQGRGGDDKDGEEDMRKEGMLNNFFSLFWNYFFVIFYVILLYKPFFAFFVVRVQLLASMVVVLK